MKNILLWILGISVCLPIVVLGVLLVGMICVTPYIFAVENDFDGDITLYAEGNYSKCCKTIGDKDIPNRGWGYIFWNKPIDGVDAGEEKGLSIFQEGSYYRIWVKDFMPWHIKSYFVEEVNQ